MHLFIDNTTLHRAHVALTTPPDKPVYLGDAMALFHFAEHVMFTSELTFSTFETGAIKERSEGIKAELDARGITKPGTGPSFLNAADFTDEEYAKACHDSAAGILDQLGHLHQDAARTQALYQANAATGPLGAISAQSPITKWLTRKHSQREREQLRVQGLTHKAHSAYDYLITTDETIYHAINLLTATVTHERQRRALGTVIDVIFRVNVNNHLALQRGRLYAPAPQRACVVNAIDTVFRHGIERAIMQAAREEHKRFASPLLEEWSGLHRLPLPLFALHHLRHANTHSPHEFLQRAITLRDHADIEDWRTWLAKPRTSQECKERALSVKGLITSRKLNLFDLLRIEVVPKANGAGFSVSPASALKTIGALLEYQNKRRLFLAALKDDLTSDYDLGGAMQALIGRTITTKAPRDEDSHTLGTTGTR